MSGHTSTTPYPTRTGRTRTLTVIVTDTNGGEKKVTVTVAGP